MKKFLYCLPLIVMLSAPPLSWAVIPMPARIFGTVTVDGESITSVNDTGYHVEVTKDNGTPYNPPAEDLDGFTTGYSLNIPKYDATDQPGGAITGESAVIHLYFESSELIIISPLDGEINVNTDGSGTVYNIVAYSPRTLTINNPDYGGTITPATGNEYAYGTEVTLIATPTSGYVFSGWTGNVDDPSSPTTYIIMDADQIVSATFSQCSYTLTVSVNNSQMGVVNPAAGDYERACNAIVNITATPNSGYNFSSWTGNVANTSTRSTTVTMNSDQTVTANFVAVSNDDDDDEGGGGGGGGGGIFGEISIRDVLGYHFDGYNSRGVGVYMPVTSAYKALKGAQTHVEGFAPGVASFIRGGFDYLEQKAEKNKDGFLYRVGTYTFPVLGKIAAYYLDIVDAEGLKADAYADTTISIEDFKVLEQQGKAVAPHRVNFEKEMETDKAIE